MTAARKAPNMPRNGSEKLPRDSITRSGSSRNGFSEHPLQVFSDPATGRSLMDRSQAKKGTAMLILQRDVGEVVEVIDDGQVILEIMVTRTAAPDRAWLGFTADRSLQIHRKEIADKLRRERRPV